MGNDRRASRLRRYTHSVLDRYRWTPNFSANGAEIEVEKTLRTYHLAHRSTILTSGALRMVARPEKVANPALGWAALGLDAAGLAFAWWRSGRWGTLRPSEITVVDSLTGLPSIALASSAMTLRSQVAGTAWSNRSLNMRVSSVFVTCRTADARAIAVAFQLLPHLTWLRSRSEDGRRGAALLPHVLPRVAVASLSSMLTYEGLRQRAREIDRLGAELTEVQLQEAVRRERERFEHEVLAQTPDSLRAIRDAIRHQRDSAAEVARAEERRLRQWLRRSADHLGQPFHVDADANGAEGEVIILRLIRQVESTARVGIGLMALHGLRRHPGSDRPLALVSAAAVGAYVAVAAVAWTDAGARRIGSTRLQRMLSLTEMAAAIFTAALQSQSPDDRGLAEWAEELAYGMSVTAGTAEFDEPIARISPTVVGLARTAFAMTGTRPFAQRAASAADELLLVQASASLMNHMRHTVVELGRRMATMSTELTAKRLQSELDAVRLEHQALVHDGPAQVLLGVSAESVDLARLEAWLDREIERLEAGASARNGADPSVEEVLADLAREFKLRDLDVTVDAAELPDWTRGRSAVVEEIVREALNNTCKHTSSTTARCEAQLLDADGGVVAIRVIDTERGGAPVVPGSGIGTSTMRALARLGGGTVDWTPTAEGGTTVTLVLER